MSIKTVFRNFVQHLIDEHGRGYHSILHAHFKFIYDWVNRHYVLLRDKKYKMSTKMHWLLTGLEDFPQCDASGCSNKITKNVRSVFDGYYTGSNKVHRHCSQKCAAKDELTQAFTKKTKFEQHGDENFNNRPKFVETCKDRYGVINAFQCQNAIEARKKANVYEKSYQTKKKNHTFNVSKDEKLAFKLLKDAFGDNNVETQFKSEKYPFNCDFYIKSLDTYIELNAYWTHGFHPYNPSSADDKKRLKYLKHKAVEKSSQKHNSYKTAIYVWTKLDPKKKSIAESNGIKLLTFYSIKQLEEWACLNAKHSSLSKI